MAQAEIHQFTGVDDDIDGMSAWLTHHLRRFARHLLDERLNFLNDVRFMFAEGEGNNGLIQLAVHER